MEKFKDNWISQLHYITSIVIINILSTLPLSLFTYSGSDGETIYDILKRTDSVLAKTQPKAVVLFWDSDCSNYDESIMSPSERDAWRAAYRANLVTVCNKILATGSLLAIVGPELLGEGTLWHDYDGFFAYEPTDYLMKIPMLDDYREINKGVALQLNIPYIDMRQAFIDGKVDWPYYSGCVTFDGEHPNNYGSIIIANLFSAMINQWLKSSPSCT